MTSGAPVPNSSSPVVVWRCDDCGWTILDDDAVDGQSCEAWLDGETEEHGTCLRLVMVPAEVTDVSILRGGPMSGQMASAREARFALVERVADAMAEHENRRRYELASGSQPTGVEPYEATADDYWDLAQVAVSALGAEVDHG